MALLQCRLFIVLSSIELDCTITLFMDLKSKTLFLNSTGLLQKQLHRIHCCFDLTFKKMTLGNQFTQLLKKYYLMSGLSHKSSPLQ